MGGYMEHFAELTVFYEVLHCFQKKLAFYLGSSFLQIQDSVCFETSTCAKKVFYQFRKKCHLLPVYFFYCIGTNFQQSCTPERIFLQIKKNFQILN